MEQLVKREDFRNTVTYMNVISPKLKNMTYMMAVKIKVKDLKKALQHEDIDESELGDNIKTTTYHRKIQKEDGTLQTVTLHNQKDAETFLYYVAIDNSVDRTTDNWQDSYFQLEEEFVKEWLCVPNLQHKKYSTQEKKFLKKCQNNKNKWYKIPPDILVRYQQLLREERIQLLSDKFHMIEIVKIKTNNGKKVICKVAPSNETTREFFHELVLCQDEIDFLDMGSTIDSADYNVPILISATCSKRRVIGSQVQQINQTSDNAPGIQLTQGEKTNASIIHCLQH